MGRGHVRPKAEPSDDATSQGTTLHRRFQREQGLGSGAWPPELREDNCCLAAPVCVTGYGSPEHSAETSQALLPSGQTALVPTLPHGHGRDVAEQLWPWIPLRNHTPGEQAPGLRVTLCKVG